MLAAKVGGLNQKLIASQLACSERGLRNWLTSTCTPGARMRARMSELFAVSEDAWDLEAVMPAEPPLTLPQDDGDVAALPTDRLTSLQSLRAAAARLERNVATAASPADERAQTELLILAQKAVGTAERSIATARTQRLKSQADALDRADYIAWRDTILAPAIDKCCPSCSAVLRAATVAAIADEDARIGEFSR